MSNYCATCHHNFSSRSNLNRHNLTFHSDQQGDGQYSQNPRDDSHDEDRTYVKEERGKITHNLEKVIHLVRSSYKYMKTVYGHCDSDRMDSGDDSNDEGSEVNNESDESEHEESNMSVDDTMSNSSSDNELENVKRWGAYLSVLKNLNQIEEIMLNVLDYVDVDD